MNLETATILYALLVTGVFAGIWVYYDRRDHARFEIERRQGAFQCSRCGRLYAVQGRSSHAGCTRCGEDNPRIRI